MMAERKGTSAEHDDRSTVGDRITVVLIPRRLRLAIVHVARHCLRLAETRSPAEMEALIWQYASTDRAGHGPSCAASSTARALALVAWMVALAVARRHEAGTT